MATTYPIEWKDMSDYLVHFTKGDDFSCPCTQQLTILYNQVIEARSKFGVGREWAPVANDQKCVCFSEIPLHQLSRLVWRRSRYGLGFRKDFLMSRGAAPVWYVQKDNHLHNAIYDLMTRASVCKPGMQDPIWRLTPFIDAIGVYSGGSYRFEWEREWRHLGNFCFQRDDPAFLIIPQELHNNARRFFEMHELKKTGPGYFCPFIDPQWDHETILGVLHPSK